LKILALDASTEYCSAAIWRDEACFHDGCLAGQRHSQLLLPMIDGLLSRAGLALADLDAIAYGEGPGSFTGLRIACGVAQGLAYGAGRPVVGIGTLLALAAQVGAPRVACCLDARMHEVYFAAYRRVGDAWETVHAPGLYAPDALPALPDGPWVGCGSGFAAYPQTRTGSCGIQLASVVSDLWPHAREIAALAAAAYARGESKPAAQALPLYIRDKVALTVEEQR